MEIHFKGTYSKEEFLAASALGRSPILKKSQTIVDAWVILAFIGGVLVIAGVSIGFSGRPLGALLAVLGIFAIVYGLRLRHAPLKLWEQSKGAVSEWSGTITEEGIQVSTYVGQHYHPWSELTGYGEHQDVIVLFHDPVVTITIPKSFIATEDEWNRFRDEVSQRLSVTHSVRPLPRFPLRLNARNVITALILVIIILLILFFGRQ